MELTRIGSPRGARRTARVALVATFALALAACGGAKVGEDTTSSAAPAPGGSGTAAACGTVNIAINPWVGYEADAAVVAELLQSKLGCTVVKKNLDEQVSWQGFGTGEVDVILENWGHEDLKKKYIEEQKVAVEVGPTGREGKIGWFVVPWMAEKYPDITDSANLNKYADLFKTSESGDKGQFLDGDPGFVTIDGPLIKNLGLNFKVIYAGSEAALITSFRQAEKDKKPAIGYFYSPQWFLSEVPLVNVKLPPYTPGCDADPKTVKCDYPVYNLDKIASAKFATSGSPGYDFVKKFQWTNDDQNVVAKYIAVDKMSPEDAAKKWIADNQAKVDAWFTS
ncbi:ABC transporter substrate-binding protein [Kineosporia sp. R_H_3]|uniref:ABC transporter substrate-binding protein n=1 Tax=Kineosporia sp. R_H_3 TaxID=1961848 RepID=UPI000B4B3E5B